MKTNFEKIFFIFSFLISFVLFFLIMDLLDPEKKIICFDCGQKFGFPFYSLETGGQAFSKRILWFGFIANILTATFVSFLIASFFSFYCFKSFQKFPTKIKKPPCDL